MVKTLSEEGKLRGEKGWQNKKKIGHFMFNQKNRLRKKKDIERVFKLGKSFYSDSFGIRYLKNSEERSRFCVIISKKTSKKAVTRNKNKRRVRAIFISSLSKIKSGFDIAVIIKKDVSFFDFLKIEKEISFLLKKSNLYYE